jgi:hypothetical protein
VSSKFQIKRPNPPKELQSFGDGFAPDPIFAAWIKSIFITEDGTLCNADHRHLRSANIGVLWTNAPCSRQGQRVVGMAEIPRPPTSANKWHQARFNFQLTEWFGRIPDFLLTFDARYAVKIADLNFCATIEHELYHCGQAKNQYGCLKFRKNGSPVWTINPHEVEEHVGVIRRYGVGAGAGKTVEFVAAARKVPLIGAAQIAGACGTCTLKLA